MLAYIYNENPNYKTHQLFVDSFLVTNVLRGLSNMAVASLQEDEYGIFQQTLADIITVFMQLQKVSQSQFDFEIESTRTIKLMLRSFQH